MSPRDPLPNSHVDHSEVARFAAMASEWWNPKGVMRPLHKMNPTRLSFIREKAVVGMGLPDDLRPFAGKRLLDVGCGGGILCEPLARLGAAVTGIDPAAENIAVARLHAEEAGLSIDYRATTVEALAAAGERFDVVTALEVVEHVPDVGRFLAACAAVLEPGGMLFVSTINRGLRSFALAIVGAEYILRWLPVGTHDWKKFVTPEELRRHIERAGLSFSECSGMLYEPLQDRWRLSRDTAVNYIASATKRGAPA